MKTFLNPFWAGTVLAIGLTLSNVGQAFAATLGVTAKLTADNFYGLYYGNEDGSLLNFVGRNEFGATGNPGVFNWSNAETWNFNLDTQDYLYIVVWDNGVDTAWVGEFNFSNGQQLLSKVDAWEYLITQQGVNPSFKPGNNVPSNSELNWEIANAVWQTPGDRGPNVASTVPWGRIPEVTTDAHFLDTATNGDRYTIFRTKLSIDDTLPPGPQPVPEPAATTALALLGILGVGKALSTKRRSRTLGE